MGSTLVVSIIAVRQAFRLDALNAELDRAKFREEQLQCQLATANGKLDRELAGRQDETVRGWRLKGRLVDILDVALSGELGDELLKDLEDRHDSKADG